MLGFHGIQAIGCRGFHAWKLHISQLFQPTGCCVFRVHRSPTRLNSLSSLKIFTHTITVCITSWIAIEVWAASGHDCCNNLVAVPVAFTVAFRLMISQLQHLGSKRALSSQSSPGEFVQQPMAAWRCIGWVGFEGSPERSSD